ncbi:MAG: hypothetical protein WKF52_01355 [Sphingomicrobium sp.]
MNDDVEWALDFERDPPRNSKAEVVLKPKSGAARIIFHLVQAPGIRFDTRSPIWVIKDGPCPPPKDSTHSEIRVVECHDKMLIIHDSNDGKACDLVYQLNFIGAKGLDPMIRNGGSV